MAKFSLSSWFRKMLGKGVNKDMAPELLPDGYARSQFHVRPTSTVGATGSVEAVGGEQLLYNTNIVGQDTYVSIGSWMVNGRVVEFWASSQANLYDPLVRIDGVVAAQSPNIPYTFDRPLQAAVETRCRGGVIYPADHNSPPLYWDVDDMLEQLNAGTGLYFDEYVIEYNAVALSTPAEFPRFDGLVSDIQGLPTGQYLYSLRYVTPSGDRTNRGPETPLISVPIVQDFNYNTIYPGGRTAGGVTNQLAPTTYGIRLRFRVDNTQGYGSVEVCRQRFNDGQGISAAGEYQVVGRIPIEPGQFDIITFTDPGGAPGGFAINPPETIPSDEAANQQVTINRPKSVELADNRLLYANAELDPIILDLQFPNGPTGVPMIPITQRLTTVDEGGNEYNSGHNDPVNLTYLKSYARGERYGFGIQPWDPQSAKLPVTPIPGLEDYQFPNRRDVKGSLGAYGVDSQFYSTDTNDAANTQCQSSEPVTPTFEVLTQGDLRRPDPSPLINVNASFDEFLPMTPTQPSDSSIAGWDVSPQVERNISLNPNSFVPDSGNIFAQRHHALGGLLYGVDNIPPNVKAITLARTQPANRVVAQGMGFWDLDFKLWDNQPLPATGRTKNKLRVHFPDVESGLVQQSTLEDIANNPESYALQIVGAYGFYQDVYGLEVPLFSGSNNVGNRADMLLYASVLEDGNGDVNIGAPSLAYTIGPSTPSLPGQYIGYGKWRNPSFYGEDATLPFNTQPEQGNYLYGITSFVGRSEGRGYYWEVLTDENIYTPSSEASWYENGLSGGLNTDEIRKFFQPVYTVNIVRRNAVVQQQTSQLYQNTGMTIKMSSPIGIIPDPAPSSIAFELINERLEDVRPFLYGSTVDSIRYVYVKEINTPARAWVNVTNMDGSVVNGATVLADIAANGFWTSPDGTQVFGVYEVRSTPSMGSTASDFSSGMRHEVVFGEFGGSSVPPASARITVKFCGKNIRFFGGDTVISKEIFSPIDGISSIANLPPLPMWGIVKNPNYQTPDATLTSSVNYIRSARQIAVMWDAETRVNSVMNLFDPLGGMNHPRTNYILRPYYNIDLTSAAANGMNPLFDSLYDQQAIGQNVAQYFQYGGICFRFVNPEYNYDYSKQPNITFVGVPEVGFEDRTDLCNAIFASTEVDPAAQDQPGLRTFLASNIKLLSQENGEIKVIASALGDKAGRNMYAWTEKGVSRILTNKNILSGASGEQISTQEISNYWGDEMVLTNNIGLPDQMWRMFAKAYAPIGSGYADSFFWMDRKGVYRMTNDNIVDISRDRYLSALTETLQNFPTDYSLNVGSLYNTKDNEVWFGISEQSIAPDPPVIPAPIVIPPRLFVYNALRNEWIDQFAFQFDTYLANDQQLYGFRDLQTYNLDVGSTINGLTREAKVMVPFFGDIGRFKQHLRWRITPSGALADAKPDEIRIYDESMNLLSIQNEALAAAVNPAEAQYWVLWYDGWEQHTACSPASIDPQERPPQSHGFFVELIWRTEGYKSLLAVSSQLQNIH
jgi:hypothetical protein